jgi:Gram-negative porin
MGASASGWGRRATHIQPKHGAIDPRRAALAVGAGLLVGAPAAGGRAAEVGAGGPLELTITGSAAFLASGGELAQQREDPELSDGLDFSTDTEVHILARARDEELGLDYGATLEFEADADDDGSTDETRLFVRGGWGELRLGDVDGPVDASSLGAFTVAAGTGGIDGDIVDALAVDAILPLTSDDATKVRYYTPSVAGLQFGLSYTPTAYDGGDSLATTTDTDVEHWAEAAAVYEAEFELLDLTASVTGGAGELKDPDLPGELLWTAYAGTTLELEAVDLGAGIGVEDAGGQRRRYANLGAGRWLDPVYASVTHGRVLDTVG